MALNISPGGGLYCGPGFRLFGGVAVSPNLGSFSAPQVIRRVHCPYRDNLKGISLVEKWCNQSTTSLEKFTAPTSIEFDVYRAQDAVPASKQSEQLMHQCHVIVLVGPQSPGPPWHQQHACCAASEAGGASSLPHLSDLTQ